MQPCRERSEAWEAPMIRTMPLDHQQPSDRWVLVKLRSWAVVLAVAFGLSGCASIGDVAPTCQGQGVATTFLMSQSVPAAKYIPCLEAMPAGWRIDSMDIKSSGSRVSFSLDRGGAGALQVILEPRCDVSGADRLPSDEPGTRLWEEPYRFEERYTASRFYVFQGGCVTYKFNLPQEAFTDSNALSDIFIAFTFLDRAELNQAFNSGFEAEEEVIGLGQSR
jgi:hypothetical protein